MRNAEIAKLILDANDRYMLSKESEIDDKKSVSIDNSLGILKSWTRHYIKKNQLDNYIRITRVIPPGQENRNLWKHLLQLWVKGNKDQEVPIDADTFDFISSLDGWEDTSDKSIQKFVYKNQQPGDEN